MNYKVITYKNDFGNEQSYYNVSTELKAWEVAHLIINDLVFDKERTESGSGKTWSNDNGETVINLGGRLEVNTADGKSVNIWIARADLESSEPRQPEADNEESRITKLITYYETRLNECIESRKQLLDSNANEEIKNRLKNSWNVRINEILSLLLILQYGTAI